MLVLLSFLLASVVGGELVTGYIYCDNSFEFYLNGQLIASDPVAFTPHNAVRVSYEWDGVSERTYAIMCQDYASASGYEYTETNRPQLGDGALLAEFSDGVKTSGAWKHYVVTHGPTDASIQAGCGPTNLGVCVVEDRGEPLDWAAPGFGDSAWESATEFTTAQAGWGRTPSYDSSTGMCGQVTSPLTRANVDNVATEADACLNPQTVLCGGDADCGASEAQMIWGASLDNDNKVLFRYTASPRTTTPESARATTTLGEEGQLQNAGEDSAATTDAPNANVAATASVAQTLGLRCGLTAVLVMHTLVALSVQP